MSATPSPHPRLWSVLRRMHLKTDLKPARQRPDTATLEKPLVLDPGLLRKVDMTRLTRDRLLTIENLITTPKKARASPKPKEKPKTVQRSKSREEKLDVNDSGVTADESTPRKHSRIINTTFRVRSHVRKGLKEVFSSAQQLSSHQEKPEPTKTKNKIKEANQNRDKKSVEDVFGTLILSEHEVPSPCSTCGRSERPERLHAHPAMPLKRSRLKDDQENTAIPQRSSVTKPVAIKFRSGKLKGDKPLEGERPAAEQLTSPSLVQREVEQRKTVPLIRKETFKIERGPKTVIAVEKKTSLNSPSPTRKFSFTVRRQTLPRTPPAVAPVPAPAPVVHSASPRRPRTVTCYLCHKQFGSASYPLHEPQCLQKWHRENEALPSTQQQAQPQRPATGQDVWEHAWEAAQAVMVACDGCSRTFLPHRLEAHRRVCPQAPPPAPAPAPAPVAAKQFQVQESESDRSEPSDRSDRSVLLEGPTSVHCHICGRVFNKLAIDRHEQHCLQRWRLEHSRDSGPSTPTPRSDSSSPGPGSPGSAPSSPRRRPVLCYLCGRQFGSASIAIHEPQCLRRWRQENERLPAAQRRREPRRPDLVLDPVTGQVDEHLTAEAQWHSHLGQLVPCGRCGRTFNPDRVVVHERCCKGPLPQHTRH